MKGAKPLHNKSKIIFCILFIWCLIYLVLPVAALAAEASMTNFVLDTPYNAGQFADVDESKWYGESQQQVIKKVCELGIMVGRGNGFAPDEPVTLAEAITMAARLHDIYNGGDGQFVQGNPWYQVYVDYAVENGIINSDDFSNYNRAATRAEMAYIFAYALPTEELTAINTVNSLPDVNEVTPYKESIFLLYRAGVLMGNDTKGTFTPYKPISRAQAAAIITRIALPQERQKVTFTESNSPSLLWTDVYTPGMWVNSKEQLYEIFDLAAKSLIPGFEVSMSQDVCDFFVANWELFFKNAEGGSYVYSRNPSLFEVEIDYSLNYEVGALYSNYAAASLYASEEAKTYDAKMYSILSGIINDNMTEYEKAKVVHDYLIKNYKYDTRLISDPENPSYYRSYSFAGLLDNGIGVCQAYAELFYHLLCRAGVDCYIVYGESNGVGHAWNIVYLDGEYYHVDATYDDPVPDVAGRLYYDYFCLTDSEIAKNHTWERDNYPVCTGTKY